MPAVNLICVRGDLRPRRSAFNREAFPVMKLQNVALRAAAVSLAVLLAQAAHVSAQPADATIDPAFGSMLGSAAPPERVRTIGQSLRVPPPADKPQSTGATFFSVLRDTGTPGSPKFEVSGASFDFQVGRYPALRIENARVVLVPSADGRSCRFEFSGSPFGTGSNVQASGTIEWKTGPAGGDKLDAEFRIDDAPVEAVRTWLPKRMDASFSGLLDVHGKANGYVGEVTTEDLPATPLKGNFEATLDWTAIGRTAPMTIRSDFSLDDRMLRLIGGRLSWLTEALDLKGWAKTGVDEEYDLTASFTNVDTAAVAARWNVPKEWTPVSTLTGKITMRGKPGEGLLRHEARAPLITLPALGGYDVRIEDATLSGSLAAINAEVAISIRAKRTVIGGIDLGQLPIGFRWWEKRVMVTNSNSKLFDGENDGTLTYEPAKHPEFVFQGRVKNADAALMLKSVVPSLDLEVDGKGSVAFAVGQDQARTPQFAFHGSLSLGRIGGADLFGQALGALAKADPALALPAGTVPPPRKGEGTRVDRWFFEADRKGEVVEIGGLFLVAGDFRIDGDGTYSRTGGLDLGGTVGIPKAAADQLVAAAPWIAPLRRADSLYVPVKVKGPLSKLTVELAPGFADVLAKAKRGEAVEAIGIHNVKHVGPDNLAIIPGDPAGEMLQ
jgi:hypothetical protein